MIILLRNWIINALAVLITAFFLSGIRIDSITTALIVALILGIINAVLKPLLLFLTLPLNILTLGLFTFVINAFLIELTSTIVSGFVVANFWWALLFSLVLSIINSLLYRLVK